MATRSNKVDPPQLIDVVVQKDAKASQSRGRRRPSVNCEQGVLLRSERTSLRYQGPEHRP